MANVRDFGAVLSGEKENIAFAYSTVTLLGKFKQKQIQYHAIKLESITQQVETRNKYAKRPKNCLINVSFGELKTCFSHGVY